MKSRGVQHKMRKHQNGYLLLFFQRIIYPFINPFDDYYNPFIVGMYIVTPVTIGIKNVENKRKFKGNKKKVDRLKALLGLHYIT